MSILDMRTVLLGYVISDAICAIVMVSLWRGNRQRSPGLGFWMADFGMQCVALVLVVLRGSLPSLFSMVLANTLIVGGTLLLYIGLEQYTGNRGAQWHNYVFLGAFTLAQSFFVFVQPSLQARNINFALALLVMTGQCAWLLLRRVDPSTRANARLAGVVFCAFSLVSLIRIFADLAAPPGNDLFKSGLYDTIVILTYQMLYIALTFSLFLMVNRRLFGALEEDIRERRRTEEALRVSEEKYSIAFNNVPDALVITSVATGEIIEANESFFRMSGFQREESIGRTTITLDLWGNLAERDQLTGALRKQGRVLGLETQFRRKSGELLTGLISAELIELQGQTCVLNVIQDTTERRRMEEERERLQAQLTQARKMEAVGQLAGGVAHHYNNMLTVILGHADLAMATLDPSQPLRDDVEEIVRAATRLAEITQQLLAFARKQAASPRVLDLNQTVEGVLKTLRRLLRQAIDLTWTPQPGLWPVRMDASQVGLILATLCSNADDAIVGAGEVTIEASNIAVDEPFCATRPDLVPGDYVRLSISDTGCGMSKDTVARLFEPFFTTKPVGKGTGLGLPMVYGIVRQNAGFIEVQSEPGRGTTFRIYLPRYVREAPDAGPGNSAEASRGHGETILLVESDPTILRMLGRILEPRGYRVLTAGTPGEAVGVAREHTSEIHLVITDTVMPDMSGAELVAQLLPLQPDIRRLYMSDEPADVIAGRETVDPGAGYVLKPLSAETLAAKVREVLDQGQARA